MTTDAVNLLKGRRRAAGAGGRRGGAAGPPPPPAEPADSMSQVMTRRNPALFDPGEMPVVVEAGGHVPNADFTEFYMLAEVDGVEHVVPDGCRTPVARQLWVRGQHVRRDVYLTYLKETGQDIPVDQSGNPDEKPSGEE